MKDNKLIAEFMGVNVITIDDVRENKNPYISSADGYLEDDLKYHCSWDWLMPVMAELVKRFGSGWIFEEGYDLNTRYDAVVKFIKQMEYKWKL